MGHTVDLSLEPTEAGGSPIAPEVLMEVGGSAIMPQELRGAGHSTSVPLELLGASPSAQEQEAGSKWPHSAKAEQRLGGLSPKRICRPMALS